MVAFTSDSVSKPEIAILGGRKIAQGEQEEGGSCPGKGEIRDSEGAVQGMQPGLSAACPRSPTTYMQAKQEASMSVTLKDPPSGSNQCCVPLRTYLTPVSSLAYLFCLVVIRSLSPLLHSLPLHPIPHHNVPRPLLEMHLMVAWPHSHSASCSEHATVPLLQAMHILINMLPSPFGVFSHYTTASH